MTSTHAPERRLDVATAVGILAGPVVALAGWAAVQSARTDLPERVATHWGPDGEPDRFSTVSGAIAVAALLTVAIPVVGASIGLALHRSTRHLTAALATGLACCLGVVSFGTLLMQRDGRVPGDPGLVVVGGIAAGVVLGLLVGRLLRPARDASVASGPLPLDAPVLDVPPTARLAWTGATTLAPAALAVIGAAVLCVAWLAARLSPWLWLLVLGLAVLALLTLQATVVIDAAGVRVQSLGLVTWSRSLLQQVDSAGVTTVRAIADFGGWGWRLGRDGRRGFVTRSGEALVIRRVGQPDLVITIGDAARAAAVLNTLAVRAR